MSMFYEYSIIKVLLLACDRHDQRDQRDQVLNIPKYEQFHMNILLSSHYCWLVTNMTDMTNVTNC